MISVEDVPRIDVQQVKRSANEWVVDLEADCEVRLETYAWQETPVPEDVPGLPEPEEDALDDIFPRALLRVSASFVVTPGEWTVNAVEVHDVQPVW